MYVEEHEIGLFIGNRFDGRGTATGFANDFDVAFVGHTDLSVSMGIPGQFDDPRFVQARDAVARACQRHGKTAGCLVANPDWGRAWMAAGYRMVAYLGDIWLFANALKAGLDAMRPK